MNLQQIDSMLKTRYITYATGALGYVFYTHLTWAAGTHSSYTTEIQRFLTVYELNVNRITLWKTLCVLHRKGNNILNKVLSQVAPKYVKMSPFGTTRDENVIKMMTFQCMENDVMHQCYIYDIVIQCYFYSFKCDQCTLKIFVDVFPMLLLRAYQSSL